MAARFTAVFDAICVSCLESIDVGEEALYVDGEILCVDCGEDM